MIARDVAEQALRAWQEGAATGNWSALIALLADDVGIVMPFGEPWAGMKHGRDGAAELFRHAADDLVIRLDQQPTGPVLDNGDDRFAWELHGTGTVGGNAAQVSICLWFKVANGRIAAIHEYATRPAP